MDGRRRLCKTSQRPQVAHHFLAIGDQSSSMNTIGMERGHGRLLRDLDAVELLTARRHGATARLHRALGSPAADELVASLAGSPAPARRRRSHG
jgi:hypothetical protein